jgi:hypothetical protein
MNFDVGCYRITLPDVAVVMGARKLPPADTLAMVARLGPFEITAHTDDRSLEQWHEFVDHTTKWQAKVCGVEVNRIPGLMILASAQNTRRLDYSFKAPGRERIDIVAWADARETTERERHLVRDAIETLCIRPPTLVVPRVV